MSRNDPEPDLVVVDVNGRRAQWAGGVFSGDPVVVKDAEFAAHVGWMVPFALVDVQAGGDDPLSAVGAIASYCPGRAVLRHAPDWVWDAIEAGEEDHYVLAPRPEASRGPVRS